MKEDDAVRAARRPDGQIESRLAANGDLVDRLRSGDTAALAKTLEVVLPAEISRVIVTRRDMGSGEPNWGRLTEIRLAKYQLVREARNVIPGCTLTVEQAHGHEKHRIEFHISSGPADEARRPNLASLVAAIELINKGLSSQRSPCSRRSAPVASWPKPAAQSHNRPRAGSLKCRPCWPPAAWCPATIRRLRGEMGRFSAQLGPCHTGLADGHLEGSRFRGSRRI
jgi:hypothetical protein